jgi:chorismate-pyruvate lyase
MNISTAARLRALVPCVLLALASIAPAPALSRDAPPWPDSELTRTQAVALLQTFNADLLSHPSATLTLESWCGLHHLADPAKITAQRERIDKPLSAQDRQLMGIGADEPVRYRRVKLACGGHVLSEADNWYVPARLTPEMNQILDTTDQPFGKVVAALKFRRETKSARTLWHALPDGWEMGPSLPTRTQPLAIPHQVLQHKAVLYDAEGNPFSLVVETYTNELFAFPAPAQKAAER